VALELVAQRVVSVDEADAEEGRDPRRVQILWVEDSAAADVGEERRRGAQEAYGGEEGPYKEGWGVT